MGLELFYKAFLDLTSCRGNGYGTEGPIPWDKIVQWAEKYELDEEQEDDLHYHIQMLDEVYLKFKAKKIAERNKPPPARPKGFRGRK